MKKIFNYENYQWVSTPNFELEGIGTVRCETYEMEINDFFEKYKDKFIYLFAIKDGAIRAYVSETMHMPLPNGYVNHDDLKNLNLFIKRLIDEDTLEDELLVAVARDFMYYVYEDKIDDYINYYRKKYYRSDWIRSQ